ncbi:Glyoxylase, beta-lactamase superfamily II [Clostridium sp. USBA 49]|jgi:glyoxylase-like metal-dependent hydrolase (beta-lactamase superfamily II)|uniref:MBL fold metallo-hydrolase n=1 Tax=Clostridium TaxID=1485 RepID=UPI00099A062B|nr:MULTISPECIES: MBL fold metallo-hydrolase [Clostridium]SKA75815.1 Glyoxylase, beta-lactamase superfamily II [Clostridium sp. USBA 49]
MIVKRIPVGIYAANCYILIDDITNECAIIDPGENGDELVEYIKSLNVLVKFILLTHGHIDHIGAVGQLKEAFGVKAYINKNDGELIQNGEFMFGPLKFKGKDVTFNMDVEDGKVFNLGNLSIECIETPGHSPGGVCYKVDDKLFTGDTLFLRSIGRTDLSGGNFDVLIKSIKNKLFTLNDNFIVFPGHGAQTNIKYEKENNPFI